MTLLELDPNWVKPGWTPLLITLGLALVMVLLFLSMRRQFRKIQIPDASSAAADQAGRSAESEAGDAAGRSPGDSTDSTPPAAPRPRT